MHITVGYIAEETTKRAVSPRGSYPPTLFYAVGQYLAAKFSHLTISIRVAAIGFAVLTPVIVAVLAVARMQAKLLIIDLPEAELRRTLTTTLAACESLHDGHFTCTLDI